MPNKNRDKLEDFINSLKRSIHSSSNKQSQRKLSSILKQLGNPRRNQKFIEHFHKKLQENHIAVQPKLTVTIPFDSYLAFEWTQVETAQTAGTTESRADKLTLPEDFLCHLFRFSHEAEYQRLQAALDSYLPIALFLIPGEENFFAEVIEQTLSYELVQKRQYSGDDFFSNEVSYVDVNFTGDDSDTNDEGDNKQNEREMWNVAEFYQFPQDLMRDVILGDSGMELLASENFEKKLQRLAHFSNKHNDTPFFLLFHCPSRQEMEKANKQDILELTIANVARRLPNVFRLESIYDSEDQIPVESKQQIIEHFQVLYEVPSWEADLELELFDLVSELRRLQSHAEHRILLEMETEIFHILDWEDEKDEQIYLKYFSIRYLHETRGFAYKKISSSSYDNQVYEQNNDSLEYDNMPDINANFEVLVEITTLFNLNFDKNVYLSFIQKFSRKLQFWQQHSKIHKQVQEIYFVFPGFEIARNYYQIQKLLDFFHSKVERLFQRSIALRVFTPDYLTRTLFEVDFRQIRKQPLLLSDAAPPASHVEGSSQKNYELGFDDVIGLAEEKETLNNIKKLQEQDFRIGIGGILFYGLPGCGKTFLARAFAAEINRHFFSFSPAELSSVWIGQSQKNIRNIFAQARGKSPSLLFIDELDSIGIDRDAVARGEAHSDQAATVNQLLIELNNVYEKNILVVAATNRLSSLDSALKRSGRFDLKIPIFPPNAAERAAIFAYYIVRINEELIVRDRKAMPQYESFFQELGQICQGFTPADIQALCNLVRMDCLLEKPGSFTNEYFFAKTNQFLEKGQRSLKIEDVERFIEECKLNDYHGKKLDDLAKEWL
ncbi:MAG: AAA family ATPase [Spirochaetota bacterium]